MNIKRTLALLGFAAAFLTASSAFAEKAVAGPKGGRLLDRDPAPVEFFMNGERKAELHFYSADLKAAARGSQSATLTAERPEGRTQVALTPTPWGFVSEKPLPEGTPYRVVVQLRSAPGAKPKNYRIDLNLANCGGCSRAEYACTCDSH